MKNLTKKIRNKRLKGNISLLVILVLLASSVIALLAINQIQRLISYGSMTFNYFRSFYLAKAGTELGLAEVYYREAGFENSVSSGDSIIIENLQGSYTGFNPYFTMAISGNFEYLTNDVRRDTTDCLDDNKISLGTGEGIMLSLFRDETEGIKDTLKPTIEKNIKGLNDNDIMKLKMKGVEWSKPLEFTFGLFSYNEDGSMDDIIVENGNDLKSFLMKNIGSIKGNRRYLTIKNPGTEDEVVKFCIYFDGNIDGKLIPYSNSLITVQANYGDMEVGLQSVIKKEVPFWALDVLGNYN